MQHEAVAVLLAATGPALDTMPTAFIASHDDRGIAALLVGH
jgi:hypothetical protein